MQSNKSPICEFRDAYCGGMRRKSQFGFCGAVPLEEGETLTTYAASVVREHCDCDVLVVVKRKLPAISRITGLDCIVFRKP
jgi:hypothetical protein